MRYKYGEKKEDIGRDNGKHEDTFGDSEIQIW